MQPANDGGLFQKVALQPGDPVTIVMFFTALDFGQPAQVEVLDGGVINGVALSDECVSRVVNVCTSGVGDVGAMLNTTGEVLPVSTVGQLAFSFRAGDGPGLHRVSVIVNGNQYILQFWQQDPNRPNSNPNILHAY